MQGTVRLLLIVIVIVAILALAGWIFPDFGVLLGAAAAVVIGAVLLWNWFAG